MTWDKSLTILKWFQKFIQSKKCNFTYKTVSKDLCLDTCYVTKFGPNYSEQNCMKVSPFVEKVSLRVLKNVRCLLSLLKKFHFEFKEGPCLDEKDLLSKKIIFLRKISILVIKISCSVNWKRFFGLANFIFDRTSSMLA